MSFSAARIPVAKSMGFRERRFSSTKDPSESGEFLLLFCFLVNRVVAVMELQRWSHEVAPADFM